MITHAQRSSRDKVWFDLPVSFDGTILSIPAGTVWADCAEYAVPIFTPTVGTSAFGLFIERVGSSADYALDLTGEGTVTPFRPQVLPKVVWRDAEGQDIHLLRHVDA